MTKKQATENVAQNTILDRALMGAAGAAMVFATFITVLDRVKAPAPSSYIMAGMAVSLLVYLLLAPVYRAK